MAITRKVHVALNVSDVDRSVAFYRAVFGLAPVKWKPGYAKFDIAEPPLNLTLNQKERIDGPGALNHLGIEVPSTKDVLAAKDRLRQAGVIGADEMNVDCCFALQDKTWITDPDGYSWEIFTVKVPDTKPEMTNETIKDSSQTTCCGQ